jgi:hypothetical protein
MRQATTGEPDIPISLKTMKTRILVSGIVAACAATVAFAAPADDIKAAAGVLAGAANYSWTTTTQNAGGGGGGQFGGGPTAGVTETGGYTIRTVTTPNGAMLTVSKGDKRVMQTPGGSWMTPEEMRAQMQGGGGQGGPGGAGGRGGMPGMGGAPVLPADEVKALLTGGVTEFAVADGAIVGTLSPEAVAPMLSRGPRGGQGGTPPPPPKNAMGTVKFWVQDGALMKYEVHVKGTVTGRNGEDREIDRTTTTEIKAVGTTKVEVPAEAKAKLGA